MQIFKIVGLLSLLLIVSCNQNNDSNENTIFSGNNINGQNFKSDKFLGMPMIINFWYPSCPPCAKEIPTLVEFDKKNDQNIVILGVIHNSFVDSKQDSQKMITKFNVEYINLYDKENLLTKKFNVLGFPTTLFLDKNHRIITKWTGFLDETTLLKEVAKIKE